MQNIIVRSGGASISFKYLDWDSRHFGRNCYVLEEGSSVLVADPGLPDVLAGSFNNAFVTAKLLTSTNHLLLEQLQAGGFIFIDTEITFKRAKHEEAVSSLKEASAPRKIYSGQNECEIKMITDETGFGLIDPEEIGKSFSMTRFHRDSRISKALADGVWIEYLRNYSPSNDRIIFAAISEGKVVGSILVNLDPGSGSARIFYVAVSRDHRGKGIGSALLEDVKNELGHLDLFVGTQASNIPALNFYLKCGFAEVNETKTVLHMWND